jgi:hypothetical protein
LEELPPGSLKGKKIAAWDTRVDVAQVNSKILTVMVKLFGYAAPKLEKQLLSKGGTRVVSCEGFYVKDKEGPVTDGEMDRASKWIQMAIEADV